VKVRDVLKLLEDDGWHLVRIRVSQRRVLVLAIPLTLMYLSNLRLQTDAENTRLKGSLIRDGLAA